MSVGDAAWIFICLACAAGVIGYMVGYADGHHAGYKEASDVAVGQIEKHRRKP